MSKGIRVRSKAMGLLFVLVALAGSGTAAAACGPAAAAAQDSYAARIAAVACRENALWDGPFIDSHGRLASLTVAEVETTRLADGTTPAWKRVTDYWRGAGLMPAMAAYPGAGECAVATTDGYPSPACRAFVVDRPWSAAFVSWVMVQAGLPGFRPSPSHFDYVRDAWQQPGNAYVLTDPDTTAPTAGDLLCFVRGNGPALGYAGLKALLVSAGNGGLPMHCDVVTGTSPGGDNLYLVGGNVLQGTTLRMLPLNRNGLLWSLPRGPTTGCAPGNEGPCSFNRQDWAALLKLKPQAELARLAPPQPVPSPMAPQPAPAACCVNCVVGSGVPRCPATSVVPLPGS
jgi:hypothetical protein